ncbi:hypothetical protein BVRB_4g092740 [Beta vulgaris subsp. vulgaris]|nr:hypothetical protein BVRB_4g092740 [Beta vulgaris subsp. vulgaris]
MTNNQISSVIANFSDGMTNNQISSAIANFSDGIDDVEDFVCANEGESSISYERFQQVFEFVQSENQAFCRGRFEEVI